MRKIMAVIFVFSALVVLSQCASKAPSSPTNQNAATYTATITPGASSTATPTTTCINDDPSTYPFGNCSCNTKPSAEVCNGIDDDCDGVTDNHLTDTGGVCYDCQDGQRYAGNLMCVSGNLMCSGLSATGLDCSGNPIVSPTTTPTATVTATATCTLTPVSTTGCTNMLGDFTDTATTWAGGYIVFFKYTVSSTITVNAYAAKCYSSGGYLRAGIYGDSGGEPGALIAQSALQNGTAGWANYSFPDTVLLAGDYWIGLVGSSTIYAHYPVAGGRYMDVTADPDINMPASPGTLSTTSYSPALYFMNCY